MAGAICDAGFDLEKTARLVAKAEANTHSIGIATSPAQLPGVDKPLFELPEGEIEYGMGIHGERGILRTNMESADVLVERMYDQLMADTQIATITRSHSGVLDKLSAEDTRNMLIYVADCITRNKGFLTDLDSAIGDGDHGISMAGGMQKAKKKLLRMAGTENVYDLFETTGKTMLLSMGGASGVIFGSFFLAGAKGMENTSSITSADLAAMERKSLTDIQSKGGAQVGDKTMVDALSPAVDALEDSADLPLIAALRNAEEAARKGMENTKDLVARCGRAKSLMERSIGYPDAGAASVWIIFRSMREYVEDSCEK